MRSDRLEGIEHTVELTHIWTNELNDLLKWENKQHSYRLLRTVLQALRDWLPINEAANFGAQLPTLLRGVYYEHWNPAATPVKKRGKADFLARLDAAFATDPIVDKAAAVSAVFGLLDDKITSGETNTLRKALPEDVRALWPAPRQAA